VQSGSLQKRHLINQFPLPSAILLRSRLFFKLSVDDGVHRREMGGHPDKPITESITSRHFLVGTMWTSALCQAAWHAPSSAARMYKVPLHMGMGKVFAWR